MRGWINYKLLLQVVYEIGLELEEEDERKKNMMWVAMMRARTKIGNGVGENQDLEEVGEVLHVVDILMGVERMES